MLGGWKKLAFPAAVSFVHRSMKGSVMPQARHNHGFLSRKALEDQLRTAQREADEARQQASGKEQSVNSLEARLKSAEKVSTLAYTLLAKSTVQ